MQPDKTTELPPHEDCVDEASQQRKQTTEPEQQRQQTHREKHERPETAHEDQTTQPQEDAPMAQD
eukprot:10357881-Prorocentrum_lima.AAC.1